MQDEAAAARLTSPSSIHRERITLAELRLAETMRLISVTLCAMGSGFQPSVLSGYQDSITLLRSAFMRSARSSV